AFFEGAGRDGEVLPESREVHEAQVNGLHFLLANESQYLFGGHCRSPEMAQCFLGRPGRQAADSKSVVPERFHVGYHGRQEIGRKRQALKVVYGGTSAGVNEKMPSARRRGVEVPSPPTLCTRTSRLW